MNIELLVSPLTRKILIQAFGAAPIRIPSTDPVFDIIVGVAARVPGKASPVCNDVLMTFDLPDDLCKKLVGRSTMVRNALHRFYLAKMLEFARLSTMLGVQASRALRSFADLHDIDEDDYPHETAFRMYQRYRVEKDFFIENGHKKRENGHPPVLSFSRPCWPSPSDDRLRKIAQAIWADLRDRDPNLPVYIARQVEVFTWIRFGRRPAKEVAKKMRRSPSKVYAAAAKIQGFLEVDALFSEVLGSHLPACVLISPKKR